jgi:hypothetical protein
MAASDHLGEQLRMFMTARELHAMPSADVGGPLPAWRTHGEMWSDKAKDNADDGLGASVAKHGVEYPVTIAHRGEVTELEAGHHRIQAAYDHNPESYVPVQHRDYSLRNYREPLQPVTPRFPSFP